MEKFGIIELLLIALKIDDDEFLADTLTLIERFVKAGDCYFKNSEGDNTWLREMKKVGLAEVMEKLQEHENSLVASKATIIFAHFFKEKAFRVPIDLAIYQGKQNIKEEESVKEKESRKTISNSLSTFQ